MTANEIQMGPDSTKQVGFSVRPVEKFSFSGYSDDEHPVAIPIVIVHGSTIITLNQRNKFFKIIFHLILILYHIISYVVISTVIGAAVAGAVVVAATDDVVVRKVSNSGRLLAIPPRHDIMPN